LDSVHCRRSSEEEGGFGEVRPVVARRRRAKRKGNMMRLLRIPMG